MSIHTLQDLCYAYSVADPVREALFALQDRITELEKQRKPLTDEQVSALLEDCIGSLPVAKQLIRAVEAAHGIKDVK